MRDVVGPRTDKALKDVGVQHGLRRPSGGDFSDQGDSRADVTRTRDLLMTNGSLADEQASDTSYRPVRCTFEHTPLPGVVARHAGDRVPGRSCRGTMPGLPVSCASAPAAKR